jgi:alcohol dehydrogenase class IV
MLRGNLSHKFQMPVEVHFGPDALSKLPGLAASAGSNFLLVTAPELTEAAQKVREAFAGTSAQLTTLYLDSPEPSCAFIDKAARELGQGCYDGLIGVGGGSAIDCAKELAIALTNPKPIWEYANLPYRPAQPLECAPLPVFAVPTTSGTGSEVTPYGVLTNTELAQKGTIQQPEIFPRAAFVDPALARTMPPGLTAATGLDALAHALESCINVSKSSPVSELAGREAIRLVFKALPGAVREPHNLNYRAAMAWASTLAGMAIAHRGTTTPHAIAEPLGAITHLPHAQSVVLCLVPVLRRTWSRAQEVFCDLSRFTPPVAEIGRAPRGDLFVEEVDRLIRSVPVRRTIRECVQADLLNGLAERLLKDVVTYKFRPLKQHPVQFTPQELREIVQEIVLG